MAVGREWLPRKHDTLIHDPDDEASGRDCVTQHDIPRLATSPAHDSIGVNRFGQLGLEPIRKDGVQRRYKRHVLAEPLCDRAGLGRANNGERFGMLVGHHLQGPTADRLTV